MMLMKEVMATWQHCRSGAWNARLEERLAVSSKTHFVFVAQVRYSSPLFRLPSAATIRAQLRFHNTGPDQASAWLTGGHQPSSPFAVCIPALV